MRRDRFPRDDETRMRSPNDERRLADSFRALSSRRRIRTFFYLYEDVPPKKIAELLDVTRPAIQNYIDDFKELGWIESDGNDYVLQQRGENIRRRLLNMDGEV